MNDKNRQFWSPDHDRHHPDSFGYKNLSKNMYASADVRDIAEIKVAEKIISTGYLKECGVPPQPDIVVHFERTDKQIVYDGDKPIDFVRADLTLASGFFGSDVI